MCRLSTFRKLELAVFVILFSIWIFFYEYHDLQDSRGKVRLSLFILSTTYGRFTDT